MTSLNKAIQLFEEQKGAREAADVMRRIADVEMAQRIRALRESEKREDELVAAVAAVLDDLDSQQRKLEEVYMAATRLVTLNREEIFSEAKRLNISFKRIEEYRRNSILLGRIPDITDYATAADFLAGVPGVREIARRAYEAALDEGRRIKGERNKKNAGEPFDDKVARQLIPVLCRCEYTKDDGEFERYFLAHENSFARKVLQDVKEHLRTLFPFMLMLERMREKRTTDDIRHFLFTQEDSCHIAVLQNKMWVNGKLRKYAILAERRPSEEALEVLDVASKGEGPDLFTPYIGKIFRYKVYEAGGKVYPELRHIRDNANPFYRILLKILRDYGWQIPEQWLYVPYPKNWK